MVILGLYRDNGEKMETTILCAFASVRVRGSSWLEVASLRCLEL